MSKHTPGPWKIIETHYLPHDGDHVADMSNGLMVVPTMRGLGDPLADARLIAAAPDLLEALKACDEAMNYMSEYDIPLTLPAQVKAAIVKAKGALDAQPR